MKVTAVLAHPDDELMCAGTLAKFAQLGADTTLVTMFMDERRDEWGKCAHTLGYKADSPLFDTRSEDTFVWSRAEVVAFENSFPRHLNSDLFITHRDTDDNTSHGHIARLVRTVARKNNSSVYLIDQSLPGGISPEPAPNLFVDISRYTQMKLQAIKCYESQLERYPGLDLAIMHRDGLYGWQTGVEAAEGFTLYRGIIK